MGLRSIRGHAQSSQVPTCRHAQAAEPVSAAGIWTGDEQGLTPTAGLAGAFVSRLGAHISRCPIGRARRPRKQPAPVGRGAVCAPGRSGWGRLHDFCPRSWSVFTGPRPWARNFSIGRNPKATHAAAAAPAGWRGWQADGLGPIEASLGPQQLRSTSLQRTHQAAPLGKPGNSNQRRPTRRFCIYPFRRHRGT